MHKQKRESMAPLPPSIGRQVSKMGKPNMGGSIFITGKPVKIINIQRH